jgi:GTPase SAR1 family protein
VIILPLEQITKKSGDFRHNEAKLIIVGNEKVGKTYLANWLVNNNKPVKDQRVEGTNISKCNVPVPSSESDSINLNIWDFGREEIYYSTHKFFLTKSSIYLLVWNARTTMNYDDIHYWLHTIEAFGEDSPIILVMNKMNESDDDLYLKYFKSKFPQITGYLKIDNEDDDGVHNLRKLITKIAWKLPLMNTQWTESWYRVRKKLEECRENWIKYDDFYKICITEGLNPESVCLLDECLHELGVTLHFKDRIALNNIVILKPEWATEAFYKILHKDSVIQREGILLYSELDQIWDKETYPKNIYPQLMELMNKFELFYELPDKNSYLVPELLPKSAPFFIWDEKDNLCFYYCYDPFLPPGIITQFIVRMHQDIQENENGQPLRWREGTVLKLQSSYALVEMKTNEKQIEIRIKDGNRRESLAIIRHYLDLINFHIKKINVSKEIPCICSKNCLQRYKFEELLEAEDKVKVMQCHKNFKNIPISLLLDGYVKKEEMNKMPNEPSSNGAPVFNNTINIEANPTNIMEQSTSVVSNFNVELKIYLPEIQIEFNNFKEETENLDPTLESDLDEIQNSLDEVSANSEKEKLNIPFNKLHRFLYRLSDPNSYYNKLITGAQKGIEYAQKVGRAYNKVAPLLGIPKVPEPLL